MNHSPFKPEFSLVHDYLQKWSDRTPNNEAVIQHETGLILNYKRLNEIVDLYALCLVKLGVQKGDRIAAMALKSIQYLALQYACFKVGAIICPIDINLRPHEVVKALNKISPRLFFLHGTTPLRDFTEVGKAVADECHSVQAILQYNLLGNEAIIAGAISANEMFNIEALEKLNKDQQLVKQRELMYESVNQDDPAMIIFTTGTTGEPKPALLHHQCIVAQMAIQEKSFALRGKQVRRICMLPDSHVGGTTITMYTTIYSGGTNILLHRFDPVKTLEAIQKWKATWMGGVPTIYRMIWAVPNYHHYDIKSLASVIYAGAAVDLSFLHELSQMAPHFGTTMGMTECAGGATYTPSSITPEELLGQVGTPAEEIAAISIREPINEDRTAGLELPDGKLGEICYHPPLVFKGYFGQPEETARIVSSEGILYSGDIGYFKDMGKYKGLFLKGRRKYIIKQKGYNVFPDEIASFICSLSGVAQAEVVGVKHALYDEGIMALVALEPGINISSEEIIKHCKGIAAYKRPQHVEILKNGQNFPVNKNGKVDKNALVQMAEDITVQLRKHHQWDAKP